MDNMYFYHFNIKNKEYKVEEFKILDEYSYGTRYYLSSNRNGKEHRISKIIKDVEAFNVKRSGIYISCFSPYNDKIEEFKEKCIPHVLDYMNKCMETLDAMKIAINDCEKSLEILKNNINNLKI